MSGGLTIDAAGVLYGGTRAAVFALNSTQGQPLWSVMVGRDEGVGVVVVTPQGSAVAIKRACDDAADCPRGAMLLIK